MPSALGTRPVSWSFFLSRAVNLDRSRLPWGLVAAAWAEPPAPALAAAPADPEGRGAAGGFPAAPVVVELLVPLEDTFFTIFVEGARRKLALLGARGSSGNGEE